MPFARAEFPRRARALGRRCAAGAALAALTIPAIAGCSDPYRAPTPAGPTAEASDAETAAVATLADLQRALVRRDPDAAAELAADVEIERVLRDSIDNAARIGLDRLGLVYLTATGARAEDDSWAAEVELTWRYRGYDAQSARREITLRFSADGSEIAGVGDRDAGLPLWMQQSVEVQRGASYLVVGEPGRTLDQVGARVRTGLDQVRAVLGGTPRAVVEVPAAAGAIDRALAAAPDTYAGVAGVTAPVDGSLASDAPVHVFLNPGVYGDLDPVAAQVVITHELVHVATAAPQTVGAPLWLVEGFADYVALRDVDLPVTRTAGQIIEQVQDEGLPSVLPSDAALNLTAGGLGAQYEASWQVCVTIAGAVGEDALIAFYRDVLGGTPLASALRRHIGWTQAELTANWRARLADLAGVAP